MSRDWRTCRTHLGRVTCPDVKFDWVDFSNLDEDNTNCNDWYNFPVKCDIEVGKGGKSELISVLP